MDGATGFVGGLRIAMLVLLLGAGMAQADEPAPQRIVYHLTELERAMPVLRSIREHSRLASQGTELIVVAHDGGALAMVAGMRDANGMRFGPTIRDLTSRGVRFRVEEGTLRALGIDAGRLLEAVERVPSALAELARLQQDGFVYIRP